MIRWATLGLLALVGLAGRSGFWTTDYVPQDDPAPVMLVNNVIQTETFEVGVVSVGAQLRIHSQTKGWFNSTVGQGSSTTKNYPEHPYTQLKFPETARMHGHYTLEPGERKQTSIETVAPDEDIVVLVYDEEDGTYRSIKSLSCGGAILGCKVSPEAGGPDYWTPSVHQCG